MADWNYLDDDNIRRIIDALTPHFLGGTQYSLMHLADIVAEIGYNEATLDLETLQEFQIEVNSPAGASVVGTTDGSNVQSKLDTIDARVLEIETGTIHADLEDIPGDGSDVTALMQAMLNGAAGKTVILGVDKTYGITAINIPAATTLVSNGSQFSKLVASSTPAITALGSFECDVLKLTSVGGASDFGVLLQGSDISIGKVDLTFNSADSGSGGSVYGLHIYSGGLTEINRVALGTVSVSGHAYPFKTENVDGIELGKLVVDNYRRAYHCSDTKNGVFWGGECAGTSPSATGTDTECGVYIESTTTDGSENLRFERWFVSEAPGHSFAILGTNRVRNVHFNRCKSSNSGNAGAGAVAGSAIKVFGNPGNVSYHEDIYVDDMLIEDCSTSGTGVDNFAAVQLGMVRGGSFRFRVRKDVNTYSAWIGYSVVSSEDVHIYPEVRDARQNAARFENVATYPAEMTDVVTHGGKLHVNSATEDVVVFDCADNTFDNVSLMEGCTLTGGVSGTNHVAPTTGSYENCMVDIVRIRAQTTTGAPPTVNSNNILVRMVGPLYGTSHTQGSDGSQVTDTATGAFKIRKAGTWTTL